MNDTMNITASLEEPSFLKAVIENLASRNVDMGFTKMIVPKPWKAIESSCVQADVNGVFALQRTKKEANEKFEIPFIGAFLFTCTRVMNGSFNLEWTASLS